MCLKPDTKLELPWDHPPLNYHVHSILLDGKKHPTKSAPLHCRDFNTIASRLLCALTCPIFSGHSFLEVAGHLGLTARQILFDATTNPVMIATTCCKLSDARRAGNV